MQLFLLQSLAFVGCTSMESSTRPLSTKRCIMGSCLFRQFHRICHTSSIFVHNNGTWKMALSTQSPASLETSLILIRDI